MKNSDRLTVYFRQAYQAKGKSLAGRERNIVIALNVHDPISALAAAMVAHELKDKTPWALQVSGFGVSAARRLLPDTGEIGSEELLLGTKEICDAVLKRFPKTMIVADLDHGYGGPLDASLVVEKAIHYGIAGFNLEDQQYVINERTIADIKNLIEKKFGSVTRNQYFRKSCGYVGSKEVLVPGRIGGGKVVLPVKEMVRKIQQVAKMRDLYEPQYGHVAINARINVLSTYAGYQAAEALEDIIRRGNTYLQAGADIIFCEAVPDFKGLSQKEAIQAMIDDIKGPTSFDALRGGQIAKPLMAGELNTMGAAHTSLPAVAVEAYIHAMMHVYADVLINGTNASVPTLGFGVTKAFLGWVDSLEDMVNKPQEVAKQGSMEVLEDLIKEIKGLDLDYVANMLGELAVK